MREADRDRGVRVTGLRVTGVARQNTGTAGTT
jgi:hypothetical protein